MALKKTLLEIVQDILNDLDSDEVNSIDDSLEAAQVAMIVESVFYGIISTQDVPEHSELLKLTALSDSDYPTHFQMGDNVKGFNTIWYDTSDTGAFEYTEVYWCDPVEFLRRTDGLTSNYTTVSDKNGGTKIRIQNNAHPTFYTSFDDEYVIFNSHKSTVDSTLQESKVRAYGTVYPVFSQTDNYIPDLDAVYFPMLIAEAKSMSAEIMKGATSAKLEQAARRQRSYIQNDKYRTKQGTTLNDYGR